MKHEKTFEAINKLKDVEIELHRLKNLLEITGRALDAKSEWVGLTKEEVKNEVEFFFRHSYVQDPDRLFLFAQTIEAKFKDKNK